MSARDIWEDKPVTFAELTLDEGDEIIMAFAEQGRLKASRLLLAKTLRWADTGELVFSSPAALGAMPLRLATRVGRLTAKALFVNGLRDDDPEDETTPASNGHDTGAPGPSL